MKTIAVASLAALLAGIILAAPVSAATLCHPDEQVLFSCPVKLKDRIVSLCAAKDVTSTNGYLQYRFGTPDKIELQFPERRENSQKALHYGHYFRAQVDRTRVYFTRDKYLYELFTDEEGDVKPKISSKGVRTSEVAAPDKTHEILCASPPVNQLDKLDGVLSCDPDEQDCVSAK